MADGQSAIEFVVEHETVFVHVALPVREGVSWPTEPHVAVAVGIALLRRLARTFRFGHRTARMRCGKPALIKAVVVPFAVWRTAPTRLSTAPDNHANVLRPCGQVPRPAHSSRAARWAASNSVSSASAAAASLSNSRSRRLLSASAPGWRSLK